MRNSFDEFADGRPLLGKTEDLRNNSKILKPTQTLENSQAAWIIKQTVITTMLSFGANFGLSYVMFNKNPPPNLWGWPSPMVVSFAVTIVFETAINYILGGTLMTKEIISGDIAPLDPKCVWFWPTDESSYKIWWLDIGELGAPSLCRVATTPRSCCARFRNSLIRAGPWILFAMAVCLPSFLLLSYLLWGNGLYDRFPYHPEFVIAILGAYIAIVTQPLFALNALGNVGSKCF